MMNTPHNISRGEATSKMAANTTTGITTNRQRIQQHLRDFNFKTLFVEELGWDILNERPLMISCRWYHLYAAATGGEARGEGLCL